MTEVQFWAAKRKSRRINVREPVSARIEYGDATEKTAGAIGRRTRARSLDQANTP